jgi:uncharacterized protein YkwD
VADDYSRVLASRGTISHIGPDGSDASSRLERAGYRWSASAENLAAGQSGADDVFASWMASPHHRANILDPRMREIGVGHMLREGDPTRLYNYWVMELARPS